MQRKLSADNSEKAPSLTEIDKVQRLNRDLFEDQSTNRLETFARQSGGYLSIEVSDTGIGISKPD